MGANNHYRPSRSGRPKSMKSLSYRNVDVNVASLKRWSGGGVPKLHPALVFLVPQDSVMQKVDTQTLSGTLGRAGSRTSPSN